MTNQSLLEPLCRLDMRVKRVVEHNQLLPEYNFYLVQGPMYLPLMVLFTVISLPP
jgi:hypothetical protein